MNQRNYQKELEVLLQQLHNDRQTPPRLFLHSCCAPCSSYVLAYLCRYFAITVFYYNPNITAREEYAHRVEEQKRLIEIYNAERRGYPIAVLQGDYQPSVFLDKVKGYEHLGEGSERCFRCFDLRLRETAVRAKQGQFNYYGTTLTISPLKNAQKINEIGEEIARQYGVTWLVSDFKKRDGYKQSVELSARYGLYRQDFCGCAFSQAERERERQKTGDALV